VALPCNNVLATAVHETKAVTVGLIHIHLAVSPGLIRRFEINRDAFRDKFRMQPIHIFHN
jgi:hypothetical protein